MEILINHEFNKFTCRVANLAEAREEWIKAREEHMLGASQMRKGCGLVFVDGEPKYHISYNGRAWHGSDIGANGKTEVPRNQLVELLA